MTAPTIAQAQRDLDRLKVFLNTVDERYDAIEVECPTVVIGKGLGALQASMVNLSTFSLPSELEDLPAEGQRRLSVVTESIKEVTAQVALIRSCAEHIKSGTPLNDASGLCMAARLVRTGYLNGESVEANATLKYLEENLALCERKLAALKESKFRTSNALEMATAKNRLRYLTSLLQLSRQTPASVLDQSVVEAAIKLGNRELDELAIRLNRYYAQKGPVS